MCTSNNISTRMDSMQVHLIKTIERLLNHLNHDRTGPEKLKPITNTSSQRDRKTKQKIIIKTLIF